MLESGEPTGETHWVRRRTVIAPALMLSAPLQYVKSPSLPMEIPITGEGATPIQRCAVAHFLIGEVWLATHCHCPLDIFIQVSVQRSRTSKGFPESVPLPL